jgi:hypothetical protein
MGFGQFINFGAFEGKVYRGFKSEAQRVDAAADRSWPPNARGAD